jgi:HTH-type transcriptional regulator/antitoxin HipB
MNLLFLEIRMLYPIKTLSQLRPILQGFRKATGLTQADVAERLGVSQQSYAKIEANPGSASLERLYAVFSILNVEITLSSGESAAAEADPSRHRSLTTSAVVAENKPALMAKTKELKSPRRVTPPTNKKEVW